MHHDERVGGVADGVSEDFAGVYEVIAKRADRNQVRGDGVAFGVQSDHVDFFLAGFPGEPIEVCEAVSDGIIGAGESGSILRVEGGGRLNSPAQFDTGHDLAPCRFADGGADSFQFGQSQFGELFEAVVHLSGDFFTGLQGRFAGASGANENGEEFAEFQS